MKVSERRVLRINDELVRLRREEQLTLGELEMHRHIDDDAVRDAAVTDSPEDRADARRTGQDVARFERVLERLRQRIANLEERRRRLLARLED